MPRFHRKVPRWVISSQLIRHGFAMVSVPLNDMVNKTGEVGYTEEVIPDDSH